MSRPLHRLVKIDNDKWNTPTAFKAELDREFAFDAFDPCPIDWNKDTHPDGLLIEWAERTFVNPPYSATGKWIAKSALEASKGKTVVVLTNAVTDTKWFHEVCWQKPNVEVRFIKGRLKFFRFGEDESTAMSGPRGSMLIIFRGQY